MGHHRSYGEGEVFLVESYLFSFTLIRDCSLISFPKANRISICFFIINFILNRLNLTIPTVLHGGLYLSRLLLWGISIYIVKYSLLPRIGRAPVAAQLILEILYESIRTVNRSYREIRYTRRAGMKKAASATGISSRVGQQRIFLESGNGEDSHVEIAEATLIRPN
jgi:hypothetical protein